MSAVAERSGITVRCLGCGKAIYANARECRARGTPLPRLKHKWVAVTLAFLFGPWRWAYTYRRNTRKFGAALLFGAACGALAGVLIEKNARDVAGDLLLLVAVFGLWFAAIVDTARADRTFYRVYPAGPR